MNVNAYQIKAAITATHCCVCRRQLEDAESVQLGIGPICSRRYYDPSHTPSEEDVANALGLVVKGLTEGKFPSDFVAELRGLKDDARRFSNRLVYFTSANYDKRDIVLACAEIIRTLGYTVMADKLEIDRVKARLTPDGDRFRLYVASTPNSQRDLSRVPGARNDLRKDGSKVGWTFPVEHEAYVLTILGVHFYGDLLAIAGKGVAPITRKSWYDLQAFRNPRPATPAATPVVMPDPTVASVLTGAAGSGAIRVEIGPDWVKVRTPYLPTFKEALKANIPFADRSWEDGWRVRVGHLDQIKNLIRTHFDVSL